MYFEAETNGQKFEIDVHEQRDAWKISLKPEGEDWIHYNLPKSDYQYLDQSISFIFKNSSYLIDVVAAGTEYSVYTRGSYRNIKIYNEETLLHESLKTGGGLGSSGDLTAGMPGKIVKVFVSKGQEVKSGEPLLIMEAMKMENEMRAARDVKIKDVFVKPGDSVEGGALLIAFEKE